MKIKVCGLKYPDNTRSVTGLEPDLVGFIFYKPSPRYIGDLQPEALATVPKQIIKTAVFVNETARNVENIIDRYHFDAIQLHGSEDPGFCEKFKGKAIVIKAFGLDEAFDFEGLNEYKGKVDFFLFDTKTPIHGGTGKTFDWTLLNKYNLDIPFFLSGGLSPENMEEIKKITHPQFYGVDLNSRFETSPGMKDIDKLEKAFNIIKQTTDEIRG